jgi:integrase/recombinase XerD
MLLHKALAGTAQFQAGAVHQEMHRPGSRAWSREHLQRLRPTAERGVIGDGELKAKQADDRTDQSLRLAQPQAEHGPHGFACHFRKSPEHLGPTEIRTYLIHLTQERCLSTSSIIVTVSALRFFYAVTLKRPWAVEDDIPAGREAKKLPVVLSQEEVARFLSAIDNLKHRVILTVCYATGLRISEAVRLKPGAIDSKRMVIRVEQGKGRRDRYVMLPPKLLDILRDYWKRTRPGEWLFPGREPARPLSPLTVDRTCREVRLLCGIKPVAPHSLRHAFAVHLLEAGETVQNLGVITPHFETDEVPIAPRRRNPC